MIYDFVNKSLVLKALFYNIIYIYMDEGLNKIVKKLNKILEQNKNILEILQEMEKEKPLTNSYQNKEVDRTNGEYKNKRNIYLNKLNNKEIKEPKASTMTFYQIDYDEETQRYS